MRKPLQKRTEEKTVSERICEGHIHVLLPKIVWNGLDSLSANENFKNQVEVVFECGEEKH